MLARGIQAGRLILRNAASFERSAVNRGFSDGAKNGPSTSSKGLGSSTRSVPASNASPGAASTSEGSSTASTSSTATNTSSTTADSSSRLLKSMQAPIQAAQAEAAAAQAKAHAQGEMPGEGRAMSALSAAGNALFFAALGGAAYFGYYTVRYTTPEMEQLIRERKQPHHDFPGTLLWVPVMSWYVEHRRTLEEQVKKYSDPPSEHLLPDLPPHARHVRTLVLDLDDTLIHSDWTRGRGWRTFKRPGAEDFLRQMAQYYELVVYTDQLPTYADPILDRLDPQRFIQYRLYRDSTQYVNGKHVRNLNYLNRDLEKVLLITANADAYELHPDNAVKLKPWKLEPEDTALLDLLPLLEQIFRTNVPDVRAVVRSFEGQDIPSAFRERMRALAAKQQFQRPGLFSGLRR
ncbi:g2201 [Coccomyxa elongata]